MSINARIISSALLFISLHILSLSANSASFDCTIAKHTIEELICSDEKLSKSDEAMADLYARKMELLPSDGQELLRASQRKWNKYVRDRVERRKTHQNPVTASKVNEWYQNRMEQIRFYGNKSGELEFYRVDDYVIRKESAKTEDEVDFVRAEISYPVIASPATEKTKEMNKLIKDYALKISVPWDENPDTDVITYFKSPEVIGNIISIELLVYKYGHGAAHGYESSYGLTYRLDDLSKVTMSDIIDTDKDWYEYLVKENADTLCPKLDPRYCDELKIYGPTISLSKDLKDFGNWRLKEAGLEIYFGTSLRMYGTSERKNIVPWERLFPILNNAFKSELIANHQS